MRNKNFKLFGFIILLVFILGIGLVVYTPPSPAILSLRTLDLTTSQPSENSYFLDEACYVDEMTHTVLPYLKGYEQTGYLSSLDESQLYYEQYLHPHPKAHIVISHGFTENVQKYKEVIYYFHKAGYSVSLLDHRGHGYSDGLIDEPHSVHIDSYLTYIQDFKNFMDQIVMTDPNEDYLLYAHSMGGGIGTLFIEQYPEYFKGAVLSSPMMEIETGAYPDIVTRLISSAAVKLGYEKTLFFGQAPFTADYNFPESCTTSSARYHYLTDLKIQDMKLQENAGTFGWLRASLSAIDELIKNADQATIPILLFQSENDTLVRLKGHYAFAENAPDTELIYVPGAKHELYNAENEILIPYFNTIFDFYDTLLAE